MGGIVGYANKMIKNMIENSFNIGNISNEIYKTYDTVKAFAGGIVGGNSFGTTDERQIAVFILIRVFSSTPLEMLRNLYNYGQVSSGNIAGGIIGALEICNISNAFNFGQVVVNSGSDAFAGGIAGICSLNIQTDNGIITNLIQNSGNEGPVSGTGARWVGVGGIAGAGVTDLNEEGGSANSQSNTGTINGCYNSGDLYCGNTENKDGYIGGIAGGNVASIDGCSMTGTIKIRDDETFGWIMGTACDGASITNCYVEPSTVVVENKGSDPGQNGHTWSQDKWGRKFYLDYAYGIIASPNYKDKIGTEAGAEAGVFGALWHNWKHYYDFNFKLMLNLLGNNYNNVTENSKNSNQIYFKNECKVTDIVLPRVVWKNVASPEKKGYLHYFHSAGSLKLSNGIYTIGVNKTWNLKEETYTKYQQKYPQVSGGLNSSPTANDASKLKSTLYENAHALDWINKISETDAPTINDGIVEIENAKQLAYVSKNAINYKDSAIKLTNDIDLTGYIWTPIGAATTNIVNFGGSFDGNGYTISGMAAYHSGYAGLFASINSRNSGTTFKEIKNVRIINSVVQSRGCAGTIAGCIKGTSSPIIIHNNIIQANVYSTFGKYAASVIGNMINTGSGYKGLIVGNAVNSNQTKYASSDSGELKQGSDSPIIVVKTNTQEYEHAFYTLLFQWPVGALKWRSRAHLNELSISGSIIYNNSGFTTSSFTKFDDRVFISGVDQTTLLTIFSSESKYKGNGSLLSPQKKDLKWDEITWIFTSVSGKPNKITGFVGENNKFSYSYNGSNSSTDINRYDQNSKYFNSNYDFELKVYDGGSLIKTLKYAEGVQYSFANDIKPYALSGNAIIGYKIKGKPTVLTKDELTYSDFSTHAANKVVEIEIVRGESEIKFNVGNDANLSKTYSYTSDGGNGWIFTDENENQVGWYTPAGRTGYWVDANGEPFTQDKITEKSGSFILYWIDNSSGEGKYDMSTYFYKITLDLDGNLETLEDQLVEYVLKTSESGSSFTLPTATSTNGNLVFAGWSDGTTTYQAGETIQVKGDMTLTAQFVDKSYTLTFDGGNGVTGEMADQTITATEYTLPTCTFTAPPGKEFSGWTIKGTKYAVGSEITLSDNLVEDGKITITANWEDIEHYVTINIPISNVTIDGVEKNKNGILEKSIEFPSENGIQYYYYIVYINKMLSIYYEYALETDSENSNYNKSISQEINVATINAVLKAAGVKVNGKDIDLNVFTALIVLGDENYYIKGQTNALGLVIGSTLATHTDGNPIIPAGKIGSILLGYYGTVSETTIAENNYFRTVTYTYKGVNVASQKILKGYDMTADDVLSVITKDGYVDFVVDKNAAATALNTKGTYEVELKPIDYTVTIDGNGATSGGVAGGTFNIEKSFTVPENRFKKTGYKFVGWNTSADGKGDAFNAGDKIEYSKYKNNLTLYAQWEEIVLTLKFDKGAHGIGADSLYDKITLRFGESYTLPENRFTSNWYYEFTGWKHKETIYEVGKEFAFDDKLELENDATYTFTAQWKERDLTIKFNSGNINATGTMDDVTFTYKGGKYTLPENGFARLGFEFAGWSYTWVYEDTSGQYQTTTRVGQADEELTLDNLFATVNNGNIEFVYEITLTATWSAKYTFVFTAQSNADTFGVTLDSYDPITITLTSESLEAGYTIVNPGYVVTSGGYIFAGYSFTQGKTTPDFEVGTKIYLSTFFEVKDDGTVTVKEKYADCLVGNTFTLNLYSVWAK